MRLRIALVLALGLAVLVGPAPAGAVIDGERDGNDHPYVGYIRNLQFSCTASAISPWLVVTAAHCFDESGTDTVWVTFNENYRTPQPWTAPNGGAGWYQGTWHAHPDFCIACEGGLPGFDTHDVAIVVLDQPVMLPRYAELPALGLVDTLPAKSGITSVGYGIQELIPGGGPPTLFRDGYRMRVDAWLVSRNFVHAAEYLKINAAKGGTCFGDSGGPNLLAGTDTILGVNSYVTNGGCNGVTYSNRIDLGYVQDFFEPYLSNPAYGYTP